jgi:hypothetical protein
MSPSRLACLTIDMEPDIFDPEKRIRMLDDDARTEAFGAFLRKNDVPLTCFTLLSQARRYRDRLDALAAITPVEFAAHSYSHDVSQPASTDEVRRSWEAFGEIWNTAPLGYRAPNCLIDDRGIAALIAQGFQYDSSIVPSIRPDKFSYNNVRFDREPFFFDAQDGHLLELPVACLRGIRLPFILSYIKLFGLPAYRLALNAFPLPDAVVMYFHPFDLYMLEVSGNVSGWKRQAHLRNASTAVEILEGTIALLKQLGYRFVLMRDLAADRSANSATPRRGLAASFS